MGNVPGFHETAIAAMSFGDLVKGDLESAGRRWGEYSEQSVIGSGIRAAAAAAAGDNEEAHRLGRAMGKATGSALCGGGFRSNLPVFHELAIAGESLGDMIGYQDFEKASERWRQYSEHSVIGTGVRALAAAVANDMVEAERLGKNMIVLTLSALSAVTPLMVVPVTVISGVSARAPSGTAAESACSAEPIPSSVVWTLGATELSVNSKKPHGIPLPGTPVKIMNICWRRFIFNSKDETLYLRDRDTNKMELSFELIPASACPDLYLIKSVLTKLALTDESKADGNSNGLRVQEVNQNNKKQIWSIDPSSKYRTGYRIRNFETRGYLVNGPTHAGNCLRTVDIVEEYEDQLWAFIFTTR